MKERLVQLDLDVWDEDAPRYRKLDQAKIDVLAQSMAAIGLQNPVTVWCERDEHGIADYHLIAGFHRFYAAKKLGWKSIDALVVDLSEIDRKRWEIAENLHRAELTALERDQHVAEWIKLTDQSAQVAPIESKRKDGRGHRRQSGIRKAARELGVDRDDARRAVRVANLTPEAKQTAISLGLDDNRSALLLAAAAPPEEQQEVLREFAEEKEERASLSDDERGRDRLIEAWETATDAAREMFVTWMEQQQSTRAAKNGLRKHAAH